MASPDRTRARPAAEAVGKAGLLEQADAEDDQPAQDEMRIGTLGVRALELRDDVLVMQDRARDQMREIGDEQRVMRQCVAGDIAAVGIDQERDLGEA